MKRLQVGSQSREEACKALENIANAVGSTLGPKGAPFMFEMRGQDMRLTPTISKDGLTTLNSLDFVDPIANAVHFFAQQAAAHTVLSGGDGTTSTIVFAAEVAKIIQEEGKSQVSPQAFARKIRAESLKCIEAIKAEADTSQEMVKRVALTSANGDEELVDVVLKTVESTGAFGTIVTEKKPSSKTRYKIIKQDGYSNCAGYNYNPTFALSADEKSSSNEVISWENPVVAIFNGALLLEEQIDFFLKPFNEMLKSGQTRKKYVIFTYNTSEEVINKLIVINRKFAPQGVAVFIIKPRLTAEINSGLQVLRDLASFTNANIIDGGNYKIVSEADLGECGKVTISPTKTVLFGRSKDHWIDKRALQNENIIAQAETPFDKEITAIRNAELTEGLVTVEIGGGLLPDIRERADRFDDASKAAQACMKSGALPGCGASFIRSAQLANVSEPTTRALKCIHGKIMENYGETPKDSFKAGETVRIDDSGVQVGDFKDLNIVDACETVCAVIKNGVELGLLIATLGGYSLRDDRADIDKAKLVRDIMSQV